MHIEHRPNEQAFYLTEEGYEGELAYAKPANDLVDFQHTFVDEELRGRGIADKLAHRALEWARKENLRVRTSCPYMANFVERHHADYKDLLEA
jgi:predicted GNAT family acetyltransferase